MKSIYSNSLYAITAVAAASAGVQAYLEQRHQVQLASFRAESLSAGIDETVQNYWESGRWDRLNRLAERLSRRGQILGFGICPAQSPAADQKTPAPSGQNGTLAWGFPGSQWEKSAWADICLQRSAHRTDWVYRRDGQELLLHARMLSLNSGVSAGSWSGTAASGSETAYVNTPGAANSPTGAPELLIAQDAAPISRLTWETFLKSFALIWLGGFLLLSLIANQVQRWARGYLRFLYHSLRGLGSGRRARRSLTRLAPPEDLGLGQELGDLTAKILTLPVQQRQKPAEVPAAESSWITDLREAAEDRTIAIFANREPYIHNQKDGKIEVVRPASGLVTALEPILRNCGGLWIAHGSGSADRETVNERDEVAVPPGRPTYTLKRVWLTPEEEQGYYYGFSNEGLWPLCHLAHNRPTFRLNDWEQYCTVNGRFSAQTPDSVLQNDSIILVQDYHFALLPRMLRDRARAATAAGATPHTTSGAPKISLFWHIPWPNPEAFGICPWGKELLRGMLGSDVIGFHTQYHCNNFLETCDRYLEARIDWERFSVTMENHETLIRAFPIGIDTQPVRQLDEPELADLKVKYGIRGDLIAVGVERIDYTKGLVERMEAVERFLEKNPQYVGRFVLVQMGSPSRTHIPAYRMLNENLVSIVKRINERFGQPGLDAYKPVVLLNEHHEWDEIQYFYQLGNICLVTSLHDGMNLVAKEYVWCQRPDRGSLILSRFAGASRELNEAFIVNPYNIEEMADAIAAALALPREERERRMLSMRKKVEGHNAFHWAADLIRSLANEVRAAPPVEVLPSLHNVAAPAPRPLTGRKPRQSGSGWGWLRRQR